MFIFFPPTRFFVQTWHYRLRQLSDANTLLYVYDEGDLLLHALVIQNASCHLHMIYIRSRLLFLLGG